MASLFKSGSSKRKSDAPGKLRIVMKGFGGKAKQIDNDKESDGEDAELSESSIPDDLPEGTVIVQPEAVEDTPVKKKKEAPVRIDTTVLDNVSCTACGRQMNPYKGNALQKHPELKVVICKRCEKFLSSGAIVKDKDGIDEQCRWCGEGGRLVVCDDCSSAFCKACVIRNFNRSEFNKINDGKKWECFRCDKAPLQGLRETYRNIRDTLKALQARDKAKAASANGNSTPTSNGTKQSGKSKEADHSKSVTPSSSSSSSAKTWKSKEDNHSKGATTSSSLAKTPSKSMADVSAAPGSEISLCSSDLKVGEENVDVVMEKLSTATSTFKEMLRALRSQFHRTSPQADDDTVTTFHFSLSSSMSVDEKKRRCTKALNSSLHTFVKSMKTILTANYSPHSQDDTGNISIITDSMQNKEVGKKSSTSKFKDVELSIQKKTSNVNGIGGGSKDNQGKKIGTQNSTLTTSFEDVETVLLSDDSEEEETIKESSKKNKSETENQKSSSKETTIISSKDKQDALVSKSSGKGKQNKESNSSENNETTKKSNSKDAADVSTKIVTPLKESRDLERGKETSKQLNTDDVSNKNIVPEKEKGSSKEKSGEEDIEKEKSKSSKSIQKQNEKSISNEKSICDVDDENMAAKFDLIKELTDDILKSNEEDKDQDEDVEDNCVDDGSVNEASEDEEPTKRRSKRKSSANISNGEEKTKKKSAKTEKKDSVSGKKLRQEDSDSENDSGAKKSSKKKVKSPEVDEESDNDDDNSAKKPSQKKDKSPEVDEDCDSDDDNDAKKPSEKKDKSPEDDEASSSDVLMSSDEDTPLSTRRRKKKRKEASSKEKDADPEEDEVELVSRRTRKSLVNGTEKAKSDTQEKAKSDKTEKAKSDKTEKAKSDKTEKANSDKTEKANSDKTEKAKSDKTEKAKSDKMEKAKSDKTEKAKSDKTEKAKSDKTDKAKPDKTDKTKPDKTEKAKAEKEKSDTSTRSKSKVNEKSTKSNSKKSSEEEEEDEDEKEIEKLSKMPVMRKRKAKDSVDEDAEEDTKEDDAEKQKTAKPAAKRNRPGPKCSKKNQDFEDLSSDGEEDKMDDKDESVDEAEDDDLPKVTFCLEPDMEDPDNEDKADVDEENEDAKNKILDEMDSDNDEDEDKDSDDSSLDDDSDGAKKTKKSNGKKVTKKDKKAAEDSEEDGSDDQDSDTETVSKKKKKKLHSKLLDAKLADDSDSDSDVGIKKRRKKHEDDEFKENGNGDNSSSGSSKESDDDDDDEEDSEDDSSEGDGEAKKSKKKSKKKDKGKKKKGKGRKKKKKGDEDDDEEEEEEDDDDGKKKKGKGKKRLRIKKMTDSSDDGEEKKRKNPSGTEDEDDDDDPNSQTPGKRKKIRKVLKTKQLEDSTKAAGRAEEKRRKRIKAKQSEFNVETITDENNPMDCPMTTKLILEAGKEEDDDPVVQVNKKLIRKLKPHQVEAVQFMWNCMYESVKRTKKEEGSGCILAHCMGLGKTLSVISFVHTVLSHEKVLGQRTCLVVSPLNTVLNWQSEWKMWFDKKDQFDVWELAGCKQNPARCEMLRDWQETGGIMIIGYEMYRNLTFGNRIKNKKQKKTFLETLVDPGPDLVVCDEGHILKNDASSLSKAMNLVKTRRRVVLTGTPLQNNLNEYHCMISFVKPNLLGTKKEFNNRFISPILNGQCTDSTSRDVKIMKARAHILHEMLAGCVQRRDYSALTKFLPPKQEYVMSIRLSDVQIDLYRKYMELSGQGVDGVFNNKGARLFKDYQNLMKIWTHPWVLKLAEIRDELKKPFDDEDSFVDDDESDRERSFSSSNSSSSEDEGKKMSDSGGEGTSGGAGQKLGTRRTRAKARRRAGEESDPEEVIQEWKSKTRNSDDVDVKEEDVETAVSREWWAQYVVEDDKNKIELSNKLSLLFEILRMSEEIGDKVLIFSQSILSLNIIESFLQTIDSKFQEECDLEQKEDIEKEKPEEETFGRCWSKGLDYYRMDGSTNAQNRQAWAQSFNNIENYRTRLFLISTKAGGLGINLVAANRVIIFDASWNPSHDVQSIFRVYRFGQTKPCYIYRFLAQGTMEEKIYERQVSKLALSQRVVDEHQIERHFNSNDLKELYNFSPDPWNDGKDKPTLALPKDPLLAEILTSNKHMVVSFHEHDSLLENQIEHKLTEEEKKAAWEEYENEKKGIIVRGPGMERRGASWPMMAAAQILSREQIRATVQTLRQQLPDISEDLFQLHVQQALRKMVQLKQEEMRRVEMMRMQEARYYQQQMMQNSADPWLQIQRLRQMQNQMLQAGAGGMSGMNNMMSPALMNLMMGGQQHQQSQSRRAEASNVPERISNNQDEAIDLDLDDSPSKNDKGN